MVGDGILSMLAPRQRLETWRPRDHEAAELVDAMVEHQDLVRLAGAVEAVAGLWLGGVGRRR